jgi:glutamate dehydrogenase
VKLYAQGGALALSDAVPAFENFGFRVIEEVPTELTGGAFVHDFAVSTATLKGDVPVIEEALAAVLEGNAENDAFNRLIVEAGMKPASVVLFRAWFRYLRQTGMNYGMATVVDALRRAPGVANALIERFDVAHNPERAGDDKAIEAATAAIETGLAQVQAIDDDRILRTIRGVVLATLRTNAYAPAAKEALAFKMDSAKVPGLPAPLPWREIWVYSPRVEGIHLRAGPVARGGLRWSDRRDDFRTEILGLMKAQRVKNAVIVPTGAKGGFYPKQLPSPATDRDAWFAEGTESYRIFIRTLLSITDNIVANKVVHPEGVTILDGEDPYFVVAADKGTATFSDVANAIAIERNFWLGDAFASGGSHGYDHKAMGITAKGAWVSVRRHFLEMGTDIQIRARHRRRLRRHVGRRVRQRHAAVEVDQAGRRLRPPPHLPRSRSRSGEELGRARAHVRAAALELGGLQPRTDLEGRRRVPAHREVDPAFARSAALLGLDVSELDPTSLITAILKMQVGPALVRRHRHLHQGRERKPRRCRRSRQ